MGYECTVNNLGYLGILPFIMEYNGIQWEYNGICIYYMYTYRYTAIAVANLI